MAKHDHLHTLDIKVRYDERLWRAMNTAAEAHEHQKRKHTDEWYISHPFRVMEYTRLATDDINVHVAAVLHDTVEETTLTIDDITTSYGETVAFYVWGVTKDDTIESWRERNEAYLHRLEFEADDGSAIIALADKIANIEDQIRDFKNLGAAMWDKFHAGPSDQLWWFRSVLEVGRRRLPDNPLVAIFEERLAEYEEEVIAAT
jgi:(p)ppGpp synthase/HD superfamily hydrolase